MVIEVAWLSSLSKEFLVIVTSYPIERFLSLLRYFSYHTLGYFNSSKLCAGSISWVKALLT